jgi:hypothetical protein
MYKLGVVKYPKAITVLNKIRQDRAYIQNLETKWEEKDKIDDHLALKNLGRRLLKNS